MNPEGILFLAADDHYVATATDKQLAQAEVGYLHMVAVTPRYRGRGLGRYISLAALLHMREVPDMLEADHAERWRAIFAELGAARSGR